jgi:hypothetical protein
VCSSGCLKVEGDSGQAVETFIGRIEAQALEFYSQQGRESGQGVARGARHLSQYILVSILLGQSGADNIIEFREL